MEEVDRQMHPVVTTVTRLDKTMRSLYANGSGGPPGYLETARAEDKERMTQLFAEIRGFAGRIDAVEKFITIHETKEAERETERKEQAEVIADKLAKSDARFKRYIAMWSLGIALFMALIALFDHRAALIRTLLEPPAISHEHSQLRAGDPPAYIFNK